MPSLRGILEALAALQKRYALQIFAMTVIITVILGLGISRIQMEGDINKEMPQDLPIFQLNNKINEKFGNQEMIILAFILDKDSDYQDGPTDIRDPRIINYLSVLAEELEDESMVDDAISAASFTASHQFSSLEEAKSYFSHVPQANAFFSEDYDTTIMYVSADIGSSDDKIKALASLIDKKISDMSKPPGVKIIQTGSPHVMAKIFELLASDAIFTLVLAGLIILVLLFVMEGSITKGLLVFSPLLLGLIWTMGTMGWLGIKLSIATVGLGAMILGLGVEYGVFMLTRYKEERNKGKKQLESLKVSVPQVGFAMIGSGVTTIIGFLALTLSILPMMQHLGISLAIGIAYCLIAAVFAAPVIIILEEDFEYWYTSYKHKSLSEKRDKHLEIAR